MTQRVYFNGEILTIPGAYSTTDVSGMTTKSDGDDAKVIAIIGECTGGEPGAVQFFTEPTSARKVLKSGDLLKACEKAWNPVSKTKDGVKLGGANTIACIRTNKATKSTYDIKSEDALQVKLQSKDWGENVNYQIKLSDGTLGGTKRLTIYDNINKFYENFDNLGNLFTIKYIGEAPYASLSVYKDAKGDMYLKTVIGDAEDTAVEDLKIKLDNDVIKNIRALAVELQAYENYAINTEDFYNTRLAVTDLDYVESVNIKGNKDTFGDAYRLTAVYADIKSTLDTSSTLIEVAELDKTKGTIHNFDYANMTGGTAGVSPASWVEFFDAISNFDITYIVPLTGDVAIHAELLAHISALSGNLGRERRGIVGGNIDETVQQVIRRSINLASDRMQVVYGGFYDYNKSNELELYPPYILAAQHAGRVAFLEDGESATHDVYRMNSPEYKLERGEITTLLQAGVLAFEFVLGKNGSAQSYVRLVQDLTTDVTSTDTVHTERATGALADSLNKEIREALDNLLTGKRTGVGDLTSAKNKVLSILDARKRKGHIVDYKDVYVTKTGTVTEIDYSVAPAEPNNFTLITAHYYNQELSAE